MRSATMTMLAMLLAMAGCEGRPDPESRLGQGARVILVNPGKASVEMTNTDDHESKTAAIELRFLGKDEVTEEEVSTGTRATVISDESENVDSGRPVKIFLRDGEYEGLKGEVRRWNLRAE